MSPSSSTQRLSFLDLFRGAFALLMLQGHTFRALLDSSVQAGALFQIHEMAHSLTGPAFLLGSGAAFSFATFPRWEQYRTWSAKLRHRLLRFGILLALGYMFHLTYFSLRRTFFEGPEQLISLLSMDVLQCIAIGGLALQILVMAVPQKRWFLYVVLGAAIAIVIVSPWVWTTAAHLPPWLGTLFSEQWGSLFPLFPFLGFQFAGAAWGYWFIHARERSADRAAFRFTIKSGIWLFAAGLAASWIPFSLYGQNAIAGPAYFVPRVGLLAVMLALFRRVEIQLLPKLAQLKMLATVGRESLVAYTVHVLLLYGSALNRQTNLLSLLGSGRRPAEVTLVLILLAGAMLVLCRIWSRFKKTHSWKAAGLQVSLAGYLVYSFITG